MAFRVILLGLLSFHSATSSIIEPRTRTGQIRKDKPMNCWHKSESAPNVPDKQDCLDACNGGAFANGKLVQDYATNTHGSCQVAIVQLQKNEMESHIIADACADLVNQCPDQNATAEFNTTALNQPTHAGTLQIGYQTFALPAPPGKGLASFVTEVDGPYSVPLTDCWEALSIAIPSKQLSWPERNASSSIVGADSRNCSLSVEYTYGAELTPSGALWGVRDILSVPEVCNDQSLCRQTINGTLGGSTSHLFVKFPRSLEPVVEKSTSAQASHVPGLSPG